MRIKQNQGRVVHAPLSFIFQIVEMGGSLLQKYDASSQSFIPDRRLTPFVLQPQLIISDPDGTVATADYVTQMVNVTWTLKHIAGGIISILPATSGSTTYYDVNAVTKKLTLYRNTLPQEVVKIAFHGEYVDKRRNEVLKFDWEKDCVTETQTDLNITLDAGRWRGMVRLVPMRHWGQFGIPVQLKNGPDDIPDARASYQWQWWNPTTRAFSEDFSEQAWLVNGEQTKEIIVDQEFIQDVTLRVKAIAYGNANTAKYFVTRLKRWYGQFDYDVEFLRGKYIFHDTATVVLNAWVANARGIISNPCKYFDMELFFASGDGEFESIGYGEEAIVNKGGLQSGQPQAGILCRELSAYRALCDDSGKPVTMDDGTVIFIQIPTKSREV
ncbi:hypothetical protein L6475_02035 [Prevotella sp. E9-3]|uniref:hypothetical protein n=1 Tax=Prevotella sp. E9-3 TaxID=2913621 RepID=UPI001EDA04C5|nr:hypothetical protein [Prevotella sp. E9-3]UKK48774.1 hypothetical protein L6475_02035 [Prevotella sp. E9-3]